MTRETFAIILELTEKHREYAIGFGHALDIACDSFENDPDLDEAVECFRQIAAVIKEHHA